MAMRLMHHRKTSGHIIILNISDIPRRKTHGKDEDFFVSKVSVSHKSFTGNVSGMVNFI
jgi:hypothetical protein